jgi:NTP pyrophosphatase (non-canonical NTP hydrolase)
MKKLSHDSSLNEIQEHLAYTCKVNGWDKNSISEVYLLLSEETGELAKAIRKITGFKGEKRPEGIDENLREELADVFNYLLEIANRYNISLAEAYLEKAKKNESRVWE